VSPEGISGWILFLGNIKLLIMHPLCNSSCQIFFVTERRVSDSSPANRGSSKEYSVRSGRLSISNIGGSQPLNRLARLLNQRPNFTPNDEIPRRLSWERYVTKPIVLCILKCRMFTMRKSNFLNCLSRSNDHR